MATNSKIEWTEATWNPVTGCTRVSSGCDNCYAVQQTHRLAGMGQATKYGGLTVLNPRGDRHFNGQVRCHEDALHIPLKRRRPTRFFVNSMSDLFHERVPVEFIDRVFAVMAICGRHTFQVLTKRPERMAEYMTDRSRVGPRWSIQSAMIDLSGDTERGSLTVDSPQARDIPWPLHNVWLLASAENQETLDERVPHLLRCPAAVRGLSLEPLLGPIDLHAAFYRPRLSPNDPYKRLCCPVPTHWVIAGGESGPGARPCNIDWIRAIRDAN